MFLWGKIVRLNYYFVDLQSKNKKNTNKNAILKDTHIIYSDINFTKFITFLRATISKHNYLTFFNMGLKIIIVFAITKVKTLSDYETKFNSLLDLCLRQRRKISSYR